MNQVAEAPVFGENDTPRVRNQISNITAELSPSNKLPSTKVSRAATNADWTNGLISALVCVQHSAFPPVMEIPKQPAELQQRLFSLPLSSSFSPHSLPLLRVISQALLKWPAAILPNPSNMLFGVVSSKLHLLSPEQRGCHCTGAASMDFCPKVGKFCLMTPLLKAFIPLVRSSRLSG